MLITPADFWGGQATSPNWKKRQLSKLQIPLYTTHVVLTSFHPHWDVVTVQWNARSSTGLLTPPWDSTFSASKWHHGTFWMRDLVQERIDATLTKMLSFPFPQISIFGVFFLVVLVLPWKAVAEVGVALKGSCRVEMIDHNTDWISYKYKLRYCNSLHWCH